MKKINIPAAVMTILAVLVSVSGIFCPQVFAAEVPAATTANVQIVDNATAAPAQTVTEAQTTAAGADEYSIVAAMEDAGIQIEIEQNTVAAAQQGTQQKLRSNGTAIGILMIILLVAAVAVAVVISITGRRRRYN